MRLEPDHDAQAFGAGVRELLSDVADSAALRLAWDSESGRIPGVWKQLAALGVLGLLVPARFGGLGLDARSVTPVFIEAGRAALPEPLVETMVGAALLSAAGGEVAERWLPQVIAGEAVVAVALGPGELVSALPWADLVLVRVDGDAVEAFEAAGLRATVRPSIDRGMRLATIGSTTDQRSRLAGVDAAAAFDLAVLAVAAQLVGLAQSMLDRSVAYAKQREQFGVPIGSFQAVKHQLADVYVANAFAVPVLHRAAWSVATDAPTRSRDVSHAMHAASRAASRAARTALQVHAAIGYTYEHDLHIWMKRTWSLSSLWGDQAWHGARVAASVLRDDIAMRARGA
jgi:alkylation response protein AidB-like acyl-CoA dehydrogenase